MPDWDQLVRNLLYGAAHRPAQIVRWVGEQLNHDPRFAVGAPLIEAANEVDLAAGAALHPYVPPLGFGPGFLVGPPPPPPVSSSLTGPDSVLTAQPFMLAASARGGAPPYTISFAGPPEFGGYAEQVGTGPWGFKGVLLLPSWDGYVFTVHLTDSAGVAVSSSHLVRVFV